MNWTKHVNYLVEEARKRTNIMKRLSGSKFGAKRETLLKFYETYILSKLRYGMPIYCATTKSNMKKLKVIQNNAIRIATGAFKSSPIQSLEADAKVTSMETKIELETSQLYTKICSKHHSNIVTKINLQDLAQEGTKRRKGFITRAKETMEGISEPLPAIVSTPPTSPLPPHFNIKELINNNFGGNSHGIDYYR